ncbi:hypothetical protein [Endozoicomonas ascidiicola]|uniref:hypothetical protein n=1 Tax=Endozoicomonas ascidiicola TaxID=1698521 RepID=UPI000832B31B|nr:hypothetical protein [Endozoicomonas ascidiicola]
MTYTEYYTRWIFGLMLALVSTAALVLALAGLVQSPVEQGMAMVAGVALQACLFLFARRKQDRLIGLLLMGVSMFATAAFIEYAWQLQRSATAQQLQALQNDDFQVQQLKGQIAELNRQIDIRLKVSDRDTDGNYRGRGLSALDTSVEEKTARRDGLLEKLEQLKQASVSVAPSGSVEAAINNAPDWMRWPVWLVIAWLLDYCAIRCFQTPLPVKETKPAKTEKDNPLPDVQSGFTPPSFPFDEKVSLITERARSGAYGKRPVVREVMKKEGARHPVVKSAFNILLKEGSMRRQGQGFELTGKQ